MEVNAKPCTDWRYFVQGVLSLLVEQLEVNWIDVQCRGHVELFCKEELWRRLSQEGIASVRCLCLWFFFYGGLYSSSVYGSVMVTVLQVTSELNYIFF